MTYSNNFFLNLVWFGRLWYGFVNFVCQNKFECNIWYNNYGYFLKTNQMVMSNQLFSCTNQLTCRYNYHKLRYTTVILTCKRSNWGSGEVKSASRFSFFKQTFFILSPWPWPWPVTSEKLAMLKSIKESVFTKKPNKIFFLPIDFALKFCMKLLSKFYILKNPYT